MAGSIDLNSLFKTITQQLAEKKETLNEADDYNHNHGDHMVQIFDLVQNAVAEKSDQSVEKQLSYASKIVDRRADSGSAKLYAQGLSNAAQKFSGTDLNENSVGMLLQSLLGAEPAQQKPQPQSNDTLSSLLSGFSGQTNEPVSSGQSSQTQSPNLLGSLMSGLAGQTSEPVDSDQTLGLDNLIQAGMAYFQSKQAGETNMEAVIDALMAASPMGKTPHRSQSASIVATTIMNFVGNLNK